jgi:hypothetical protein
MAQQLLVSNPTRRGFDMNKWVNIIVVLLLAAFSSCTVENAGSDGLSFSTLGDIADSEIADAIAAQEQITIEPISGEETSEQEAEEGVSLEDNTGGAAETAESVAEYASNSEEENVNVQGIIDLESAYEYIITRTDITDTSENTEANDITSPINIPITDAKTFRKNNQLDESKPKQKILIVVKIDSLRSDQTIETKLFYSFTKPDGSFSLPIPSHKFTAGGFLMTKLFVKKNPELKEEASQYFFMGNVKDNNRREKIQIMSTDLIKSKKIIKIGTIKIESDGEPSTDQSFENIEDLVGE